MIGSWSRQPSALDRSVGKTPKTPSGDLFHLSSIAERNCWALKSLLRKWCFEKRFLKTGFFLNKLSSYILDRTGKRAMLSFKVFLPLFIHKRNIRGFQAYEKERWEESYINFLSKLIFSFLFVNFMPFTLSWKNLAKYVFSLL